MYKKVWRVLLILIVTWIVLLNNLASSIKYSQMLTPMDEFELNLQNFANKESNDVKKPWFSQWRLVSPHEIGVLLKDKYKAVQGNHFPPGSNGEPVFLNYDIKNPLKAMVQQGWRDHAFNEFVSDIIPINRTIPDYRDEWCRTQNYSKNLPQASVVITFHNEAWSTLIRTLHTVIKRSPEHLLKEVILFDDSSYMHHLLDKLSEYVECLPKVKLVRSIRREGLIRARIIAMNHVNASVVVFLDSHVECAEGWLEPLLDRIAQDATKVVSPVVDIIHRRTFEYIPQDINDLRIGGFNWELKFDWQTIPRNVLIKRKQLSAPIETPTISGGLFAIHKDYFKKLGYFDEDFLYWGGENFELSFKTWMCGGTLEIIPCSRVGHVFRKQYPYNKQRKFVRRNFIRLAKVWMDQYAKYVFERIGYDEEENFGDISKRVQLREDLKCKSFKWYLNEIYPQLEIPDRYVAYGKIHGLSGDMLCLDTGAVTDDTFSDQVNLVRCHFKGGNQFWMYTKDGEIKRDNLCLDDLGNNSTILMNMCNGKKSQLWIYNINTKQILNMATKLCISAKKTFTEYGWQVMMQFCNGNHRQTWSLDNYDMTKLRPHLQIIANRTDSCIDII